MKQTQSGTQPLLSSNHRRATLGNDTWKSWGSKGNDQRSAYPETQLLTGLTLAWADPIGEYLVGRRPLNCRSEPDKAGHVKARPSYRDGLVLNHDGREMLEWEDNASGIRVTSWARGYRRLLVYDGAKEAPTWPRGFRDT